MRIKKAAGKVYGAAMTVVEKKAMNLEIQGQLAEYDYIPSLIFVSWLASIWRSESSYEMSRRERFGGDLSPVPVFGAR